LERWAQIATDTPGMEITQGDLATFAAIDYLDDIHLKCVMAFYLDWRNVSPGQWWRLTGLRKQQAERRLRSARSRVKNFREGRLDRDGLLDANGVELSHEKV
jgi:hypothetical protein